MRHNENSVTLLAGWAGTPGDSLPTDHEDATLVGRVWDPSSAGPTPVIVTADGVFDIGDGFATVRDLCETERPVTAARAAIGHRLGDLSEIYANTAAAQRNPSVAWFLAPVDLQTLKAAGVTFAVSMIERVIEERARGDLSEAARVREQIRAEIDTDLSQLRPGSEQAATLKRFLVEQGMWSQYLEVGIGPDAEIFTKAPTLSAVGTAVPVGVLADSEWNNPEPEVALIVSSAGQVVGATLANDVNLRDVEGRSALLLPKAKDNNASCAVGPFIRLFDESFDLDVVRSLEVRVRVEGPDDFALDETSYMGQISRDPQHLVDQLIGAHHRYPDGAVLMLGTMFAPVSDRGVQGMGFTHRTGDIVRIQAAPLGTLVNQVRQSERCDPWEFGIGALMSNLARRGRL